MKINLLLLLFLVCSFGYGQRETKWETLTNGAKGITLYYRFVEDNSQKTFEVKLMIFKAIKALPFTVSEGKRFIFNFENGNTLELNNIKFSESCIGCGATGLTGSNAMGGKIYYSINDEQIQKLIDNKVLSYKIYTDDENHELEIKPKKEIELRQHLTEIATK